MKLVCRTVLAAAPLLALAACGSDNKEADDRTAVGEILPGSASDAMLPYDQVRSQNPLAPQAASTAGAGDEADGEEGDAAEEGEAAPATDEVPAGTAEPTEPAAE